MAFNPVPVLPVLIVAPPKLRPGSPADGELRRSRNQRKLRRCSGNPSLDELTTALEDWITIWNATARPFKWTKTADQIIDRICRYCSRISGPGH